MVEKGNKVAEVFPMEKILDGFRAVILCNIIGIISYHFNIYIDGKIIYYGNNDDSLGGVGKIYYDDPKNFQITVYEKFKVPNWYKEGIVYQIFVDRFHNGNDNGIISNPKRNSFIYANWDDEPMYIRDKNGSILRWDFYGGNLSGVIKKLPYLKELGVSIIYFNPIFESSSNHKYNTGNYKNIDPMFGDDDIFKNLCDEAHKLGIHIILDGVFSHSGADSIYFNKFNNYGEVGAYQSKESKYYSWYRFKDYPEEYECWWGVKDLPNIEELNSEYINYIIEDKDSVVAKWIKLGADGWRLDVADELPDAFIEKLKDRIKGIKDDSILIGEVWEDASNKVSYGEQRKYLYGRELDSITNYPFRNSLISFLRGEIDSKYFIRNMMSIYENYPMEAFYACMNILGNHDTERILTELIKVDNNKVMGIKYLKLAIVVQMTFPGVPLIYYGDEAGLEGEKDPDNRRTFPWNNINKDIFKMYKLMGCIRNKYEVLKNGDIVFNYTSEYILCYERFVDESRMLIIINRNKDRGGVVNYNSKNKVLLDIIENKISKIENSFINIYIEPLGFKIFTVK